MSDEFASIRDDAGFLEMTWRGVLEMTGRDRVRFLQGMCTNDVKGLAAGQGCLAAVVNRQGKMVAEIVIRAAENALLLEVDRSNLEAAKEALLKFVVVDDVALRTTGLRVFGVFGPRARERAGGEPFPFFSFTARDGALVSPVPWLAAEGFAVLAPAAPSLRAAPVSEATFEALRIENGFPRWGVDMDASVLPMEAGLEPIAISYTKGCYIGQEVIQRVKTYSEPTKMLVQIVCDESPRLRPGDPVAAGGQEIGRLTSVAQRERTLALGYVRKEHKRPGTRVAIGGAPATVVALPWQAKF